MKISKLTFILIAVGILSAIGLAFSMTGCSASEVLTPSSEEAKTEAAAELIDALDKYSVQFLASHPVTSRGDHGWSKFKKAVRADHVGFSLGSWIGSVGKSRKEWKKLCDQETQDHADELTQMECNMINNRIDSLVDVYQQDGTNIGALHNAIILKSFVEDDMDFETTDELVNSIVFSVTALGLEIAEVDESAVVNEIDDFFENIYDEDVSVMYNRLSLRYPEKREEFQILDRYPSTTENLSSVQEIIEFSDGFISLINESNISSDSKQFLEENISIAPASHDLWRIIDVISN